MNDRESNGRSTEAGDNFFRKKRAIRFRLRVRQLPLAKL